jgi:hypothetical protein
VFVSNRRLGSWPPGEAHRNGGKNCKPKRELNGDELRQIVAAEFVFIEQITQHGQSRYAGAFRQRVGLVAFDQGGEQQEIVFLIFV